MKKLIIIIEKSSDHYGAYADNCPGIYGGGDTVEEAKEEALKGLELLLEGNDVPDILKGEYEIEYKFDVQSFLKYYEKIFSKPALEKLTGINQKQLHHYASGLREPRAPQRKKIESALHKLGKELLSVRL
ncbi:MAG: type II toxin-antitoxin system HicB family antitoxin [Bacteroidales bacterium]|jgi:predicted RNase H-like HicB family nuclease|nr:type II toxin-antitoxin system HicB family antitoxin [Bacteroidales bacterium]